MGSEYIFMIIVTLSSHCSAYVVSHSKTDRSIATVILKEGQSAEISCMTKGTGDFFWRKGETLFNSTPVASFMVGDITDDSQPYSVTANGTLHIRSVTLKDEGNYFCRVSSTENECYGEVKILVQASLLNFDLAIDRCDRGSSCLLYLNPSQFTSLTCKAYNAPPLMTLKWFNGSKEITEGIKQDEILPQNGNSREITSTVAAVYGHPASLTCHAVDPKRSNDVVRFAHAQVEMKVAAHETLPSWIIVSVTLAGCFIVVGIFLLIKATVKGKQRKKYTKLKIEEFQSLTSTVDTKDTEISHLKLSPDAKDTEISKLKVALRLKEEENTELQELAEIRNKVITGLKTNLQSKEIALKGKSDDNAKLKGNLKEKDDELGKIRKELYKLKCNLKDKDQKLWTIREELDRSMGNLKEKDDELGKIRKELYKLKELVKQKEKEINNQREKYCDCQSKLKEKDSELGKIIKELTNLKDLAKKESELNRAKEQKGWFF